MGATTIYITGRGASLCTTRTSLHNYSLIIGHRLEHRALRVPFLAGRGEGGSGRGVAHGVDLKFKE